METTFENAKVGDVVSCQRYGAGEIIEISKSDFFPIRVRFKLSIKIFTIGGKEFDEDHNQSLFWGKVYTKPTERPKRMVTKTIERWWNRYPGLDQTTYETKSAADNNATERRIECVKLTGTYEVEE